MAYGLVLVFEDVNEDHYWSVNDKIGVDLRKEVIDVICGHRASGSLKANSSLENLWPQLLNQGRWSSIHPEFLPSLYCAAPRKHPAF